MKEYIYTSENDNKVLIRDFEEENYILLIKDGQPPLKITKHVICVVGGGSMNIKVSKAENFVRALRKNIIQEGLKNGTCKAV